MDNMKKIIIDLKQDHHEIEINEDCEVMGVFIGKENDRVSTEIKIIHKEPNLKSNTIIKAVVYDKSSFDAKADLIIQKGAKFTDAYLRIDALIVSEDATARVIPGLEITENDVKGGHGATVGMLDKEQLFYLQSRGIEKDVAEEILVEGFLADLLTKMK